MTLEELEATRPITITIEQAASIMGIDKRFLWAALQQDKFPFGVGVKVNRWAYYINTERFIKYMEAEI